MHALVRNWWVLLVRGICAVVFGVAVAAMPAAGLLFLVLLFGAYAIIFGAFAFGGAVMFSPRRRWELVVEGVVAIAAGVLTFSRPGITALALYSIIAAFAIATGVLELIAAARLRRDVDGIGWLMASGVISILFGLLMIARPVTGALAIAYMIAFYGVALGITEIAMSLRLRRILHPREPRPMMPTMRTPQPA